MPCALEAGALEPEVVVVSNRDKSVIFAYDLLCLVESGKVSSLIGNLRVVHSLIKRRVVVLTVVVAVGGNKQLDHIGCVIVVHNPTVTSHFVLTGAALGCEGRPVNNVNIHSDAEILINLLQILSNSLMVACIVGRIGDGREALAFGIACLCKSLFSFFKVSLVILADIGLAAVCSL